VRVRSNHVGSVTFQMVPEQFSGTIEVSADVPVVDTSQVSASQVWDEDYLRHSLVGSDDRWYLSVVGQAAGVVSANNPTVYGSLGGENAYLIDGMNTTDPATGTWGRVFNTDAIQEMSFQAGGFEAEFGQATGGIVNLVSKSGGNQLAGSFDVRYRDERFNENGDHYDRDQQSESMLAVSATLGGPILRDQLWFFASVLYEETTNQAEGAHFPWDSSGWQTMGKLTWQAAPSHRAILKYSNDPYEIPGVNSSWSNLESARGTQEEGGDMVQLEVNSVLSEDWL